MVGLACRSGTSADPLEIPLFDPGPAPAALREGETGFAGFCSGCHGPAGAGFRGGPPLLDTRYLAERFPDSSVRRAMVQGAPLQHWSFDAMPPVRALPAGQIRPIIDYLRWAQSRWVLSRTAP